MMANWQTLALYWYGGAGARRQATSIRSFGRPLNFYLFTLPGLAR